MVVDVRKDLNRNEQAPTNRTQRTHPTQRNRSECIERNPSNATSGYKPQPTFGTPQVRFRRHIHGSGPKKPGFGLKLVVFGEKRPFCLKERTFLNTLVPLREMSIFGGPRMGGCRYRVRSKSNLKNLNTEC